MTSAATSSYRLRVALAVHLFDLIDYSVTAEQFDHSIIGARVQVPWLRKSLIGIIVAKLTPADTADYSFRLKPIERIVDETPVLDASTLQLLQWAAHYYQAPVGEVILSSLPKLLRSTRSAQLSEIRWHALMPTDNSNLPRSSSCIFAAWQTLQQYVQGGSEAVLNRIGITTSQLKNLQKRGLAYAQSVPMDMTPRPMQLTQLPLEPHVQQAAAITTIRAALGAYRSFLLDGITGSGKTEVYLQVMQTVLARGQQVLVLVPEIGLTPQTIERFESRFDCELAILHSGLSDTQRLQAWQQAAAGKALIIIGTRLAIFTPLPRLGLVILDEEHDLSYKQQDGFRYHARDVALYRAAKQQCPIILGSATPSFESLYLVETGKLQRLQLSSRAGGAMLPSFTVLDLTAEPKQHGLAVKLIRAIRNQLIQNQQVLVFINRRGYAPVLMCMSCGWQADCPHCDAHFTVHHQPLSQLVCHHCGYRQTVPAHCPACHKPELKPIGQGTARIEEILQQLFPDTPVIRVDRDTTYKRDSWQQIYTRAHQPGAVIFLGTQMLAKGHHFPYVGLVTILNIDNGLWSADFRAPERTAQLIMQVAGRAGRGQIAGQVLLQTLRPDHPLLQDLLVHGYAQFAQTALAERRFARLPPYRYAVLLRAESRCDDYNLQLLQQAAEQWTSFGAVSVEFWGPVTAPMQKRAGFYRGHLLMLCESRAALQQQLGRWWHWLFKQKRDHELRLTLDVDPQELS